MSFAQAARVARQMDTGSAPARPFTPTVAQLFPGMTIGRREPEDESDRYLVYSLLGEGSNAQVYGGYDTYDERFVALRVETIQQDDQRRKLYQIQEEVCMKNWSGGKSTPRNIVERLDRFVSFGGSIHVSVFAFYPMNLDDYSLKTDDTAELRRVMRGILSGLCHLEDKRIVNSDLKPENVMVTFTSSPSSPGPQMSENEILRLFARINWIDGRYGYVDQRGVPFMELPIVPEDIIGGIALPTREGAEQLLDVWDKEIERLLSKWRAIPKIGDLGSVFTTAQYRAPEYILGAKATPAVAMFSLGCIIFEIFANKRLWEPELELYADDGYLASLLNQMGISPEFHLGAVLLANLHELLVWLEDMLKLIGIIQKDTSTPARHRPPRVRDDDEHEDEVKDEDKVEQHVRLLAGAENWTHRRQYFNDDGSLKFKLPKDNAIAFLARFNNGLELKEHDEDRRNALMHLIFRCLQYDPKRRITPMEALESTVFLPEGDNLVEFTEFQGLLNVVREKTITTMTFETEQDAKNYIEAQGYWIKPSAVYKGKQEPFLCKHNRDRDFHCSKKADRLGNEVVLRGVHEHNYDREKQSATDKCLTKKLLHEWSLVPVHNLLAEHGQLLGIDISMGSVRGYRDRIRKMMRQQQLQQQQ